MSMDTDEKYRDAALGVALAPDRHPEQEPRRWNCGDDTWPVARKHHPLGCEPPQDGVVCFYNPAAGPDEPWKYFSFPFRDHRQDDAPWFASPDNEKWGRRPIWRWQNPEEPITEVTLEPSLGVRGSDEELSFHCWVDDGSVRWA